MRNFAARRLWLFLWVAGFLALGVSAQTLDPARFPPLERVLAEPGDEAEHGATLKVLSDAAQQAGPAGQALFGVYYNALNDIDFRLRNGDEAGYIAFSERLRERLADDDFRAGVLARFGLGGAPPAPASESDELERALAASAPWWIATLVVVLLASPLLVFLLDRRHLAGTGARDSLPDELGTVRVLGRSYAVEMHSGTVVEKESHTEQHQHVSTSGGGATVIGDQVSMAPTQIHVSTVVTRKDCLWVRDAAGRESAWNFTNAALQARTGHALSALARPAPGGESEFLLAYNHATGQLDSFKGALARAHQPRRLAAWVLTSVLGAAMVLLAMRAVIRYGAEVPLPALFQLGNWTTPLIVAGLVAAVSVPLGVALLRGLRTRIFLARHAPAYRKHFETRARA